MSHYEGIIDEDEANRNQKDLKTFKLKNGELQCRTCIDLYKSRCLDLYIKI